MSIATKFSLNTFGNIVKNILRPCNNLQTPLGRWKLCDKKNIGLVVDYSNEDHCGTCSSNSIINIQNDPEYVIDSNDELYLYDYECLISNSQEIKKV